MFPSLSTAAFCGSEKNPGSVNQEPPHFKINGCEPVAENASCIVPASTINDTITTRDSITFNTNEFQGSKKITLVRNCCSFCQFWVN